MRQVAVTALALLLALFLLPLLLVPQGESPLPVESGNLPIDRTVVTPEASLDSGRQVKVQRADGQVETMALDDYLWGVAAAPMPAAFESEALNAQALWPRFKAALYDRRPAGWAQTAVLLALGFACLVLLVSRTYNPFIYFRF